MWWFLLAIILIIIIWNEIRIDQNDIYPDWRNDDSTLS